MTTAHQDSELDNNNYLVPRVLSYALVNYVSETVKGGYLYAKQSNPYVKAGLETAEAYSQPLLHKIEEYSHQSTIESLIHKVDQYGCRQLDKVEQGGKQLKDTYHAIKPKTIHSIETVANKIHGTAIETVLFKTVDVVEIVVDSLLPPDTAEVPNETEEEETKDANILDRTAPVITKIKTRATPSNIKSIPKHTLSISKDFIFGTTETRPQVIQYCIGVLSIAAHRAKQSQQTARDGLHKGATISKQSVEYVHQSLQHMVNSLANLVVLVKKLDPVEAKATLSELTVMIQNSKNHFSHKYGKDTVARLKDDISGIFLKAGDLLSQQVAAGYTFAHSSDNVAIQKSVEKIESIVLQVCESLQTNKHNNDEQDIQQQ